jgi:hypothetical protein
MLKLRKINNFGVAVTIASISILASNPLRKHATIINSSDVVIWLGFGEAAVVGQGIYIEPAGGAYEIDGNNLFTGDIFAIAVSGAAKRVVGVEFS